MKKLILLFLVHFYYFPAFSQIKNENGMYIDKNGELYSGTLSEIKDGMKMEFNILNGIINGPVTYYFISGKVMETGFYKNNLKDNNWIRYNENGTILANAFYSLGKKNGIWLVFDDNGNKRFEMNYQMGEKIGVWTSWDENGKVIALKDYSKIN